MTNKKKEMPFAYSAVSEVYYTTFRKLRNTKSKVTELESNLERLSKAMKEFGGVEE